MELDNSQKEARPLPYIKSIQESAKIRKDGQKDKQQVLNQEGETPHGDLAPDQLKMSRSEDSVSNADSVKQKNNQDAQLLKGKNDD